ncbi:asparagine synthase-related protein [Undibacterium sp. TJN19]|uniref:asparagine synthase-related protein n=1 Tax=Undibacterium sp. TJN19 TaxID=3413055 RepID=UPI003BF1A837
MLSLKIHAPALRQGWHATDGEISCSASWVRALQHPMLESYSLRAPGTSALVVRERGPGPAASQVMGREQFAAAIEAACAWPLQTCIALIDHTDGTVRVRQGSWGTAPVFFCEAEWTLHGHWDPLQLYQHLPGLNSLHPGRAARFLHEFDMPYSRHTLFDGLQVTTAGSYARWQGGGIHIAYPREAAPVSRKPLRPGAEPAQAAVTILDQAIRRWLHDDVRYASELSGGLDSSLVSIVCQQHRPQWQTYGIHIDAPGQQPRRQSLIDRFGFVDHTVELDAHLPLARNSPRWQQQVSVPWEEIYDEGVNVMLSLAAQQGVQAMFTGFGGDELCPLYGDEDPPPPELAALEPATCVRTQSDFLTLRAVQAMRNTPRAPAPRAAIDASSLESAALGSAMYLRHGIWPIHPLCTPELNLFCGALPWSWRVGRTIERRMLRELNCTTEVVDSRVNDSFQTALSAGMRDSATAQLAELFDAPLLAQAGLVDSKRLQAQFQGWCEDGSDDEVLPFYSAASLELCLRHLAGDAA